MEIAESLHEQETTDIQKEIYSKLDEIVQSSALVECINSIIRPYLNTTKNHVTQELLNLIMFYHNHRRYRDGVRKGTTANGASHGKGAIGRLDFNALGTLLKRKIQNCCSLHKFRSGQLLPKLPDLIRHFSMPTGACGRFFLHEKCKLLSIANEGCPRNQ